jgi:hypothetical protein
MSSAVRQDGQDGQDGLCMVLLYLQSKVLKLDAGVLLVG